MKFETLHKKINVKNVVIGVLVITLIVLVIVNRVSHAAYTSTLDVPLVNGKINYKHPDFKVMGMYVQASSGSSTYNETNTMPSGTEYVINSSKSYCNKGFTEEKDSGVVLKTVNGNHVMNNLTKNDRCFLYFDIVSKLTVPEILAKYTKNTSRNGQVTANFTENTPTTVYTKEDDDGTSYVFAGVNPNNWVKMGDIYYRIIRFNGNGSIRLIYSGTGSPEVSGDGTQIGIKEFNTNYDNNMYVGLQYTSGQVHGNGTNSTILGETNSLDATTLYGWYNNNIKNTYDNLIDSTVGFCSDRDNYTNNMGTASGGGINTVETYYGPFLRYLKGYAWQISYTPTLKCKNGTDLLKLPVGLITADEYALAGGGSASGSGYYNTTFWLHTDLLYWTMSPCYFVGSNAGVFVVWSDGHLYDWGIDGTYGVRPVINLKSTTTFETNGADGSSSKPYVVKIT